MKILALDPSTHCGWAYHDGRSIVSGTWDLSIKRDESKGMRLFRFRRKLAEMADAGIDLVVYEAVRAAGGHMNAVIVQAEIQGVLKLWCEERATEYKGYSSTEVKRYATGKGNAKKDAMIHACIHKFGIEPQDDNEADAVAVLMLAASEYGI